MNSALLLLATTEEEEPNPLVPHLAEIIVGLVAFVILFLVLRAKVFPVFERIYKERRDAIEGGIARAERAQREAQQALEQYRAQLAEARNEAARIREEAHEDARRLREEMRGELEREREERRARFEQQLLAERGQVVASLRQEVGGIAMELAERIVGHELSRDESQRRLVDDFVTGLQRDADTGGAPVGATTRPGA